MNADDVISYCLRWFEDVVLRQSWGERGIFYNPSERLKRGVYVLTVKEKDGENDRGSMLDRETIFRINIGLRKETFIRHFGPVPKRPAAGQMVEMDFDFTALDVVMPHPIYAWMGWVCVLNPSEKTFLEFETMILESYEYAKEKFSKRGSKTADSHTAAIN